MLCNCNKIDNEFDQILKSELTLDIDLKTICHSNIGWFIDKTISDDSLLKEWNEKNSIGIYFLWEKEYCDIHHLYPMRCLYIGKGDIFKRLENHFNTKDFSNEQLIYFSYFVCENRIAKYLEQLFLDLYNVPFNKSENKGRKILNVIYTQNEVD